MDNLVSLSQQLYDEFHSSGKSVGTAESCTAGAVARAIVMTSGASEYFHGGVVAYTNEVKERLLGVNRTTLELYTAVSEQVAREMAHGARKVLHTDYAVSVTGLAGPSGGSEETPVGTIWLCVESERKCVVRCLTKDEGREANLERATLEALKMLVENF